MPHATYTMQHERPTVVRLRPWLFIAGAGLLLAALAVVAWRLHTPASPITPRVTEASTPSWMTQRLAYEAPKAVTEKILPTHDDALTHELAALRRTVAQQQAIIEEMQDRPVPPPPAQPPPPAAPRRPSKPLPMLFVTNDHTPPAAPPGTKTVQPGSYIPCAVETSMNSDTGDIAFVAVTTTPVYDTATGRTLLIAQHSKIVGKGAGSQLLYGNERLRTVGLTLARRLGEPVDLGSTPVTDQAGVSGLVTDVHSHFWRLVGAVFIGGALKGGAQAMTTAMASAGPEGTVVMGVGQSGQQAVSTMLGPALSTRPTITVDAGQLCNVLVMQPLHLTPEAL